MADAAGRAGPHRRGADQPRRRAGLRGEPSRVRRPWLAL